MTRDRWVVVRRRQGDPRVSPLWPGWSAWCDLGGRGGIVTQIKSFDTHAEALAYADEQARTIEITLPADPLVWESGWDSDGRVYVRDINDNEICYEQGQLETLALHLLAHHCRKARS